MELDSHADTVVLGNNCLVLNYTNRECDVAPYTDTYQAISNVPIVTGATAYTSPTTGDTFILVFHEALWMGPHLDHSLINPNQLRNYGLTVQDNPFSSMEMHCCRIERALVHWIGPSDQYHQSDNATWNSIRHFTTKSSIQGRSCLRTTVTPWSFLHRHS
jgi:hypothetical protein